MLSLLQRLMLGCLLLIALVAGLGFLVRTSFVSLSELDTQQLAVDRATGVLAVAVGGVLREQLLIEHDLAEQNAAGASPILSYKTAAALHEANELARLRLAAARSALDRIPEPLPDTPSITPEIDRHAHVERLLKQPLDHATLDRAARELDELSRDLSSKLETERDHRDRMIADAEFAREGLRARLIGASGASLLTAVAISLATLFFTLQPIHSTARAIRRIGQGDLAQRVPWSMRDDLGTIAVEINRMAIRLGDLRETESGRRQMELQLADSIIQSIFEPVIVTNARGQLLKLNQAARELLGTPGSPEPDRMALQNTPGGDRILAAIRSALAMQEPFSGAGEAAHSPLRIGSSQRDYRLHTTPVRDADGHLLGAVSVLEDVTEMQDLDRFKTRFLSVASQKLRTPLEKLRLALHALARGYAGELRPLQADVVEGARAEAEDLDSLMSDLFAVAELEGGRRVLKIEQLRPLELLNDAYNEARAEADSRHITLEVTGFPDLPPVLGERRALRSVLENLISNALRFTPPGGIIVLDATEGKDQVRFTVRDNGRGIEADRLRTIFGRFTEGSGLAPGTPSNSTPINPNSSSSTGLGLALVQRLIEAQGGQISVESRLGQGSTFIFTLPVALTREPRHTVEAG